MWDHLRAIHPCVVAVGIGVGPHPRAGAPLGAGAFSRLKRAPALGSRWIRLDPTRRLTVDVPAESVSPSTQRRQRRLRHVLRNRVALAYQVAQAPQQGFVAVRRR